MVEQSVFNRSVLVRLQLRYLSACLLDGSLPASPPNRRQRFESRQAGSGKGKAQAAQIAKHRSQSAGFQRTSVKAQRKGLRFAPVKKSCVPGSPSLGVGSRQAGIGPVLLLNMRRKIIMNIKKLERRRFTNDFGDTSYCLTYDVTEEIRAMFGVPVKEAFAVLRMAWEWERPEDPSVKGPPDWENETTGKGLFENAPETIEVNSPTLPHLIIHRFASADVVDYPDIGGYVVVVFDDTHTVSFWTSEVGGMIRTSLDKLELSR